MNVKFTNLAAVTATIALLAQASALFADTDIKTAKSNCRTEALSTGLEDETDIKAYIDLCMQAWQSPEDYLEPDSGAQDANEASGDDAEHTPP
jgi:hypothetical protein